MHVGTLDTILLSTQFLDNYKKVFNQVPYANIKGNNSTDDNINITNLATFLCLKLGRLKLKLFSIYKSSGISETQILECQSTFDLRTMILFDGQLSSLEQFAVDKNHDWSWYFSSVLDQKTLNFFLAPLALFCPSQQSVKRYDMLKENFLKINKAYFHWQLIDDIADIIKDTFEGIVSAPGYLLISQCKVAEKVLSSLVDSPELVEPFTYLQKSNLLNKHFSSWQKCMKEICIEFDSIEDINIEKITHMQAIACIKYSLANTSEELTLSLDELCNLRINEGNTYIDTMRNRDYSRAVQTLGKSCVSNRILESVSDPILDQRISEVLDKVDDVNLLNIIKLGRYIINRTYIKAIRVVTNLNNHENPQI